MTKYAIVPVEPTPGMVQAALDESGNRVESTPPEYESGCLISDGISVEDAAYINAELMQAEADSYRAMLAASPPSDLVAVPRELLERALTVEAGGYKKQQAAIRELRALLSPTNESA